MKSKTDIMLIILNSLSRVSSLSVAGVMVNDQNQAVVTFDIPLTGEKPFIASVRDSSQNISRPITKASTIVRRPAETDSDILLGEDEDDEDELESEDELDDEDEEVETSSKQKPVAVKSLANKKSLYSKGVPSLQRVEK